MSWNKIQNNPLFIGGHRKCGTTLFVSLLDGHEELFIYPSESMFFYMFYPLFENPKYSLQEKEDRIVQAIFSVLDEVVRDWVGYKNCPGFSLEKISKIFRDRVAGSGHQTKDFLDAVFYAAWETLGDKKAAYRYWVEKTTSIEIYANTLFDWYPNAKFIHLIRDPRDNYASIKAGWNQNYRHQFDCQERLLQSMMDRAKLGMELADINQQKFGRERYLIVRYEDVVSDSSSTMKRVSDFLGIRFQPSLTEPTFCGVAWKGNNYEMKKFDAISKGNLNRWRERIDAHEAKVLEFYFRDLMKKYGYEPAYEFQEAVDAAREHYKWFNFAQTYSLKLDRVYSLNPAEASTAK